MQPGWADIIAERLWQQQKLECIFKFKKHNVHPNNEARYYVFFRGNCVECATIIECTLLNIPVPPKNTDAIINCKLKNICFEEHVGNKKRHLRGKKRTIIADMLIKEHKDAITFRREEVKRLKQFGDKSPPILLSAAVLRKAKEERLLNQHRLIFSNPTLNLLNNTKCSKYTDYYQYWFVTFFCMYWTREQQLLYIPRYKRDPEAPFQPLML